ncbi:YadA-like family protein [Mannheimia varigena]|uniref:YadA-like family protein n=1 Tax=Mannheimia varigena TaxID=85404 RepID=UPI002016BCBA|nr:YadA-like family protein [Mannheimia varigena]
MNKIFKVIFNRTTQKMEVVSELAKSQGKAASSTDERGSISPLVGGLKGSFLVGGTALLMISAMPAEAVVSITGTSNSTPGYATGTYIYRLGDTYAYNYYNPGSLSYDNPTSIDTSETGNRYSGTLYMEGIALGNNTTIKSTQRTSGYNNGIAIGDHSQSTGGLSIAIGGLSKATDIGAVALGTSSYASGFNSFAAMRQSAAKADYAAAIGSSSWANATASFAIGASATALGERSFAIGSGVPQSLNENTGEARRSIYDGNNNTLAAGKDSFSIGTKAKTNGDSAFAIGTNANAGGFITETSRITELGTVTNADTTKVANNAFALGTNTRALSNDTVAFSTNATAQGDGSIAFGVNTNTTGTGAIAFGNASKSWANNAISIGWNATSHAEKVITIGTNSTVTKEGGMAIGDTAKSTGNNSIAVGYTSNVSNSNATAIGTRANVTHEGGTAIGFEAESIANYATAIAYNSTASGENSIAAGVNSTVSGTRAAAVGYNNTVSGNDTFVLGSNVTVNTVGSVILGSDSAQAKAAYENTATVGKLTYSGFAGNNNVAEGDYVSVGNETNARQIKFVAPGNISSTSTDAINGSQLYATNKMLDNVTNSVVNNFGGNSQVDANGNITFTDIGETGKDTIHDAIKAAKTQVKQGSNVNVTKATVDGTDVYTVNAYNTTVSAAAATSTGKNYVKVDGKFDANTNTTNYTVGLTDDAIRDFTKDNDTVTGVMDDLKGYVSVTKNDQPREGENHTYTVGLTTKAITDFTKDDNTHTGVVNATNSYVSVTKKDTADLGDERTYEVDLTAETKTKIDNALSDFTVGADKNATAAGVLVNKDQKRFDVVGGENITTSVEGRTIKVDLSEATKTTIKDNTDNIAKGFNINADNNAPDNVQLGETVTYKGNQDIVTTVTNNQIAFKLSDDAVTRFTKDHSAQVVAKDNTINVGTKETKDINGVTTTIYEIAVNPAALPSQIEYFSVKSTLDQNKLNDGATGVNSIAIGPNATAADQGAIALGTNSNANGNGALSLGVSTVSTGTQATAVGHGANASFEGATAIGRQTLADKGDATAVGSNANATAEKATALGVGSKAGDLAALAVGTNANASAQSAVAVGTQSVANQTFAVAVGMGAQATLKNSVALGSESTVAEATPTNQAEVGGITYTGFAGVNEDKNFVVSVGTAGKERQIQNVAAGRITETSTDAINGSQLYAVAKEVSKGFNITADNKDLGGETEDNVKLGETVTYTSTDTNIVTTVRNNLIDFGLNKDLKVGKDGVDGKPGEAGSIGVKGQDGKDGVSIKGDTGANGQPGEATVIVGRDGADGIDGKVGVNGKDGASVVLNGKDGSIGLTGQKGADGAPGKSANISVKDGAQGVNGTNGTDGLPGKNGETRIVYEKPDGTIEEVATLNDGLIFTGNNTDTRNKHKLNTLVKVQGEGVDKDKSVAFESATGNINVKANGTDLLEIQLAKQLDLTDTGSVKMGDTTINNEGMKITNGPTFTTTKVDVAGNKITNVADGIISSDSKDAVNGSQLYQTNQNVTNVTNKVNGGFNITADVKGAGIVDHDNVQLGETITYTSTDKNIITTVTNNQIDFGLNKDLKVGKDGVDGKPGEAGSIGVKGQDGKDGVSIKGDTGVNGQPGEATVIVGRDGADGIDGKVGVNGKDGASVVLNGKDGSIGLTGAKGQDGKDGASTNITVKDGAQGVDGKAGENGLPGKNGETRIVYKNGEKEEQVANLNDGLIFTGNNADTLNRHKLNTVVNIVGEGVDKTASAAFKSAAGNINVKADGSDKLEIQLNKDLKNLNSATFAPKDGADGQPTEGPTTVVNNNGITITPKDGNNGADDKAVKLTEDGLDNGGNQVVNVDSGLKDKDGNTVDLKNASGDVLNNAVNVGDLKNTAEKISTDAFGLKDKEGNEFKQNLGTTAQITGDSNINTKVVDVQNPDGSTTKALEVSLNNDLSVGKDGKAGTIGVKGQDGKDGVSIKGDDGKDGVPGEASVVVGRNGADGIDGKVGVNGKDGASVVLNGKDGSIGLTGPKGADGQPGASTNIAVKDGKQGVDGTGKDGLPGDNGETRIVYKNGDKEEQVANLNDGLIFTGNNADTLNRHKLNTVVNVVGEGVDKAASAVFKSAAGNINVKADGTDKLEIQLNRELKDLTNAKFVEYKQGDDGKEVVDNTKPSTELTNKGITITPANSENGADAKPVSLTDKGLDNGNNQIVNVKSGIDGVDGVGKDGQPVKSVNDLTEEQLKEVGTNAANINDVRNATDDLVKTGFKITADNSKLADDAKEDTVELGQTVEYRSESGNIVTTVHDNKIDFDLANNLNVGGKDGKDGKAGSIGVKGQDGKDGVSIKGDNGQDGTPGEAAITVGRDGKDGDNGIDGKVGVNGKDGSAVVLNGKDGSIGLNGKDGKDGLTFKSADGAQGVDGKDGENGLPGKDGTTRIVYQPTNPDGTPKGNPETVATLNDGLIFTGNNELLNRHKLNTVVKIVGEGVDKAASEAFKSAAGNINVVANEKDQLEIQLNRELKDLANAKFVEYKKGDDGKEVVDNTKPSTEITNKGITITPANGENGADAKPVALTDKGLDNGNNQIVNVKSGIDGVNGQPGKDGKAVESVNDLTDEQLDKVGTNAANIKDVRNATDGLINKGFNITADNGTEDNVKLGETVKYTSDDKNIITTVRNNEIDFGLASNLTVGKDGKDGKPGEAGSIGVKGQDGKNGVSISGDNGKDGQPGEATISVGRDGKDGDAGIDGKVGVNGKDGSAVVLNGKDGSIGLNGKDGANGLTFKAADGAQGVDGKDGKDGLPGTGKDGEPGKTRIVYETKDKDGKPVTEEVATLNDGLIFTGNNAVRNVHKLNTLVTIIGEGVDKATSEVFKSAAGNINVKADGNGNLTIQLAKDVNLTNDGSVKVGDTLLNSTTLTVGGTSPITVDGNKGTIGGLTNKTFDPNNFTSGQAATEDQLKQVYDVANSGWDIAANGQNTTNVGPKGKVSFNNEDGNIIITKETTDNNVTFALNNDLTIGGPGKNGQPGKDGAIGVKGADGKTGVALNGKDGTIGINGKDGSNGTMTFEQGKPGVDGKDGETKTRIVYETKDKDGNPVKEEVATLNDGLKFVGDDGKVITKKLNETLSITGGEKDATKLSDANNIGVVNNNGTLTVKLAKDIDLTKDGSVTIGDTTVNNDGLIIKDGPSVTKAGINAGDKKITNVKDGEISSTSKDAVNGSQLYQVQQVANAGWNLTANGKDKGNVKPGATVDLNNKDGNIVITKEGNNVTFGLNNNLTIGGKDGKDGQIGVAGKDGKDGVTIKGDGTILAGRDGKDGVDGSIGATGKDGASAVLNGKDGSIGLTGPKGADGKPGASANIKVQDGAEGVDGTNGKDGLPGENGKTRIVYETKDKDGKPVTEQVATLNDGLIFSGNNEDVKNRQKLNTEVKVKGEGVDKAASENFKSASGNINVKANGTDTLEVQLAKAIDLTEDGSVTTGNTTVNNNGLTIKDGPSVTKSGIDAKGTKITNVKDGDVTATSKDAVNGSQLYNAVQNLNLGWELTVNGEAESQRINNNGKVNVEGGKNIVVSREGSTVKVATSDNPEFNSVKVGGTTISSTVAKDGVNELNVAGSNNAPTRITNVAEGVKGTDAVNVNQLKGAENRLNNRISNVDKDLRAGIAGALAAGNLYHVTQPGKSMVSAGVGTYRGQGALAVGYSRLSDNGKVGIKFSLNSDTRGHAGAAASVGYQW